MSLYWIYSQVRQSAHVGMVPQVRHTWGSVTDLPVSAAPRIVWVPTTFSYEDPMISSLPQVVEGKRVKLDGLWTRWSGADIELYAPAADPAQLEHLLDQFLLAVADVVGAKPNYRMGTGRWVDRKRLSQDTVGVIQPISFAIPVLRRPPGQIPATINVSAPAQG